MVLREIGHRKVGFLLGLLAIAGAVACSIAVLELLERHRATTTVIVSEHRDALEALVKKHEDDTRKSMKKLGFNILILPKEQQLHQLYADDFARKTMPEEFVDRLAESSIVSVNHLLPSLTQKVFWEEGQRTALVMGVRGEVPILHRSLKKPLQPAVPPGKVVLGFELHSARGLKVGDSVTVQGRNFEVSGLHAQRGSKDDITMWIDLATAQEMFDKKGEVNAILALECNCTAERLPIIRQEIAGILPDTQVIERGSRATARAEARLAARKLAEKTLADTEANRVALYEQRESFASILLPVVLGAAGLFIAILMALNVRERRQEIGILRALGVRGPRVLSVFLLKALAIGLLGAAIGCPLGLALAGYFGDPQDAARLAQQDSVRQGPTTVLALAHVLIAPLVTLSASWIPALSAARQDPARVLRTD